MSLEALEPADATLNLSSEKISPGGQAALLAARCAFKFFRLPGPPLRFGRSRASR